MSASSSDRRYFEVGAFFDGVGPDAPEEDFPRPPAGIYRRRPGRAR